MEKESDETSRETKISVNLNEKIWRVHEREKFMMVYSRIIALYIFYKAYL